MCLGERIFFIGSHIILRFLSQNKKLITEKYWKHPAFVEALQLEQCCEQMEIEMSQILLPLAKLATEIMHGWKGRLRAVTVVDFPVHGSEEESKNYDEENDAEQVATMRILLGWQDVPFMREFLRASSVEQLLTHRVVI